MIRYQVGQNLLHAGKHAMTHDRGYCLAFLRP